MKVFDFRLVSIGEAAQFYGVSVSTMRRWDKNGRLKPASRTFANHRRYQLCNENKLKVGYARVSSHDQRNDLVTQAKFLAPYCDVVPLLLFIMKSKSLLLRKGFVKMCSC